jgi:hypothetical protein
MTAPVERRNAAPSPPSATGGQSFRRTSIPSLVHLRQPAPHLARAQSEHLQRYFPQSLCVGRIDGIRSDSAGHDAATRFGVNDFRFVASSKYLPPTSCKSGDAAANTLVAAPCGIDLSLKNGDAIIAAVNFGSM